MAKRKAGVNDIIYELDNDDVVISSEDEGQENKIICLDSQETCDIVLSEPISETLLTKSGENRCCSDDIIDVSTQEPDLCIITVASPVKDISVNSQPSDVDNSKNLTPNIDNANTTIYNEDIVIDSPASISDPGVVCCESRTPLVSVRFKDRKVSNICRKKLKGIIVNLLKFEIHNNSVCPEGETDLELDIWPEDLTEECVEEEKEDNLFFYDREPVINQPVEVPRYRQNSELLSHARLKEPTPPPVLRRPQTCFNCGGDHPLRECKLPRNNAKIAENRKNMSINRVSRYHVEDEQKYGHLIPGRISGKLRHALGLKRDELPLHVYQMRVLGYPPGWLEEARISHSGITLFDSSGNPVQDPEEEEGEVCELGTKDKFDIKKILDFPGFNVPASSRYKEEAYLYGLPPINEQDSKLAMLQALAPNAMMAYKRKKLTFFPSAARGETSVPVGEAEMELDSGDESVQFPWQPPLPDEPPPPHEAPAPPPSAAPPSPPAALPTPSADHIQLSVVSSMPLDDDEFITIDEDLNSTNVSRGSSPTLDDLEKQKLSLLNALENPDQNVTVIDADATRNERNVNSKSKVIEACNDNDGKIAESTHEETTCSKPTKDDANNTTSDDEVIENLIAEVDTLKHSVNANLNQDNSEPSTPSTPKTGGVKTTSYGTPVLNIASPYDKLPSDDKFSKDVCDIINFENLPNSTGKYKKISSLLRKVKDEVTRIQS